MQCIGVSQIQGLQWTSITSGVIKAYLEFVKGYCWLMSIKHPGMEAGVIISEIKPTIDL